MRTHQYPNPGLSAYMLGTLQCENSSLNLRSWSHHSSKPVFDWVDLSLSTLSFFRNLGVVDASLLAALLFLFLSGNVSVVWTGSSQSSASWHSELSSWIGSSASPKHRPFGTLFDRRDIITDEFAPSSLTEPGKARLGLHGALLIIRCLGFCLIQMINCPQHHRHLLWWKICGVTTRRHSRACETLSITKSQSLTISWKSLSFLKPLFVVILALYFGHSAPHFRMLSFTQAPQTRWRHSGMTCGSEKVSSHIEHSKLLSTKDASLDKATVCEMIITCSVLSRHINVVTIVRCFLLY